MKLKNKTRRGVASLYVVIFTTIMLSIITLSFARIILSESAQTTDQELSNSAYDSALAGVEDAKVALLKYHDCLSRGFTLKSDKERSNNCEKIIGLMNDLTNSESCDVVSEILKRSIEKTGEVRIRHYSKGDGETVGAEGSESSENLILDQAYTCVKIRKEDNEYVSYLDRDNRSKIIPLRATNINNVNFIEFSWYSSKHYDNNSSDPLKKKLKFMQGGFNRASDTDDKTVFRPPVMKLQLIQVDKKDGFKLNEMDINNKENTNRGTLIFIPEKGSGENVVSDADSFASSNDKHINSPQKVKCDKANSPYICSVKVPIPKPFRGGERDPAASFFRVSLPYADIGTDFSIKLCEREGSCTKSKFVSVQAVVDSTGRAGDYYRRIESRVELVDVNFPFPEYAITSADTINKSFYITKSCWTEKGACNIEKPDTPNNYGNL